MKIPLSIWSWLEFSFFQYFFKRFRNIANYIDIERGIGIN